MFFLYLVLTLFTNSMNAQELEAFEIVSKKAENVILMTKSGNSVDPEETSAVCNQLILHVVKNLDKEAIKVQNSNLYVSEDELKHSELFSDINLRMIETKEYRMFKESMSYLKQMPLEFWGENLVARLDAALYGLDGKYKIELSINPKRISLMNVLLELSDYNKKKRLPKYFFEFFGHYYYHHAGMRFSSLMVEDDIAAPYRSIMLLKEDLEKLLSDITSMYARIVLLEGFSSNECLNTDIEKLADKIDFNRFFGDIKTSQITKSPSRISLMETINQASGVKYFILDNDVAEGKDNTSFLYKMNKMKRLNSKSSRVNALDKLNAYLPENLHSSDIRQAMDNFAWYVVNTLNGVLGDKEDILLFGEYTSMGRGGGVFDKMKMMGDQNLVAMMSVLAYANGLCDNRDVNSSVYSGLKMSGLIFGTGSINKEKLNPSGLQNRLQLRFSPAMMEMYNKGMDVMATR